MLFLADESCDVAVTRALRNAGHDVKAVADTAPGAEDQVVLATALLERRVLLTEDKDFGQLVFAASAPTVGVILIRYPSAARSALPPIVVDFVDTRPAEIVGSFAVIEPSRVRISRLPPDGDD
jgi:predicted nuclease of predicted toxin-antitoxin system